MPSHKKIVEQYFDCFNRQDWKGLVALVTENVVRQEVGDPEPTRGKSALERNMHPGPDVTSLRGRVTRIVEEGNVAIAEGFVQVSKKDGSSIHVQFCTVFEFEGDLIGRLTAYTAVVPGPG